MNVKTAAVVEFRRASGLEVGDVITDGPGVYRVTQLGRDPWQGTPDYIVHIMVSTIAGPVMGGLLRGNLEFVQVMQAPVVIPRCRE